MHVLVSDDVTRANFARFESGSRAASMLLEGVPV